MDITRRQFSQSFTFLMFSKAFERLGYYAMRAILVLYLVDVANGPGWQHADALELYATFTIVVLACQLLGGLLADLLLGTRKVLLLGAAALLLGYALLATGEAAVVYPGVGLIALGSGCFASSHLALIGQLFCERQEKLDSAMILNSFLINLAAMLSGILVGIAISQYSWSGGFLFAALAQLLSLGCILFILGKLPAVTGARSLDADASDWPKRDLLWIIAVLAVGALSMFVGDLHLDGLQADSLLISNGAIIVMALALIFFGPLFWFKPSASIPKLLLIVALYILAYFCSGLISDPDSAMVWLFVVAAGLVQALLYPLAMSVLLQRANPKYLATTLAVAAMLLSA